MAALPKGVKVSITSKPPVTPRDTAPDDGRTFVLDRVCTPENLGPSLVDPVRELFEDLDGKTLAEYLVGGVLTIALRHQNRTDRTYDPVMTADTRTFDSIGIL